MPMHGTSSKYGAPSYHISKWHLIEHSPTIVHAPTLCIHVHQTTPYKDIQLLLFIFLFMFLDFWI